MSLSFPFRERAVREMLFVAGAVLGAALPLDRGLSAQARPPQGPPPGAKRVPGKIPDSVLARLPKFVKLPTTDQGIFEQRDLRAQSARGFVECLERTVRAQKRGALGTVPRGATIACLEVKGEWRGVVAELSRTYPGLAVRTQYVERDAPMLVKDSLDLEQVAAVVLGMRRGVEARLPGVGVTTFFPVVMPYPSYVEVLFLPMAAANAPVYVGGDSVIQMAADGSRELGHTGKAPPLRRAEVSVDANGQAVLRSSEEKVPLVSELVAARTLLEQYKSVRVDTKAYVFTLARPRATKGNAKSAASWTITER